jgi:histidine triad (HIT) family protein
MAREGDVTMSDCIFCRIAAGEIAADLVESDDDLVAFRDLHPQAPVHVLVIPRRHIASLAEVEASDEEVLGKLYAATARLARRLGLDGNFRVVTNSGARAGQSVFHLHAHLLGGRDFDWPPG